MSDGSTISCMVCMVCRETVGKEHTFQEMMFGTHKEFAYWECFACGCLQIMAVPDDLPNYYPKTYYSFSVHASHWKTWYYRAHFKAPRLMRAICRCSADISSVIAAKLRPGARILDVGCGGGRLVSILRSQGFEAYGIDPFLESNQPYLQNSSLAEAGEGWDMIMFHHSLEHMQNHADVLRCAHGKLVNGGVCLVRIPVATWAWKYYGRYWAQLDAPRHCMIHTLGSFRLTAESAGFQTVQTIFDSNEFQFYASELYQRGMTAQGKNMCEQFSRDEMRKFRARADRLNKERLGDQAAFFLQR